MGPRGLVVYHFAEHIVLDKEIACFIYELALTLELGDRNEEVSVFDTTWKFVVQIAPNLFAESAPIGCRLAYGHGDHFKVDFIFFVLQIVLLFSLCRGGVVG